MEKMDQKQRVGVNGLFEIELLSNSIADQFIEQIKTVRSFESLNENRRNRKRWKKYKEMDLINQTSLQFLHLLQFGLFIQKTEQVQQA